MIDADGIEELAADLHNAGRLAQWNSRKVVDAAATRLRDDARRLAPRRRLPHYAETITSEVNIVGTIFEAEIGPERRGQGNLGHILEHGTAKTPPHAHMGPALDIEGPRFAADMGRLGADLL